MAGSRRSGRGRSQGGKGGPGGTSGAAGVAGAEPAEAVLANLPVPSGAVARDKPASVLVLNGPNLNLLGIREPHLYGHETLDDIVGKLQRAAAEAHIPLNHLQSNAEHVLVDRIQAARTDGTRFIILNPAGFTTTSVSMRDALLGVSIPFIEVHLSNIYKREAWRKNSFFTDVAVGSIVGMGARGYFMALAYALEEIEKAAS